MPNRNFEERRQFHKDDGDDPDDYNEEKPSRRPKWQPTSVLDTESVWKNKMQQWTVERRRDQQEMRHLKLLEKQREQRKAKSEVGAQDRRRALGNNQGQALGKKKGYHLPPLGGGQRQPNMQQQPQYSQQYPTNPHSFHSAPITPNFDNQYNMPYSSALPMGYGGAEPGRRLDMHGRALPPLQHAPMPGPSQPFGYLGGPIPSPYAGLYDPQQQQQQGTFLPGMVAPPSQLGYPSFNPNPNAQSQKAPLGYEAQLGIGNPVTPSKHVGASSSTSSSSSSSSFSAQMDSSPSPLEFRSPPRDPPQTHPTSPSPKSPQWSMNMARQNPLDSSAESNPFSYPQNLRYSSNAETPMTRAMRQHNLHFTHLLAACEIFETDEREKLQRNALSQLWEFVNCGLLFGQEVLTRMDILERELYERRLGFVWEQWEASILSWSGFVVESRNRRLIREEESACFDLLLECHHNICRSLNFGSPGSGSTDLRASRDVVGGSMGAPLPGGISPFAKKSSSGPPENSLDAQMAALERMVEQRMDAEMRRSRDVALVRSSQTESIQQLKEREARVMAKFQELLEQHSPGAIGTYVTLRTSAESGAAVPTAFVPHPTDPSHEPPSTTKAGVTPRSSASRSVFQAGTTPVAAPPPRKDDVTVTPRSNKEETDATSEATKRSPASVRASTSTSPKSQQCLIS